MEEEEQIKSILASKPIFDPIGSAPLPREILEIEKRINEPKESPSLYIRLEKYKDVLQHLSEMRDVLSKIDQLLKFKSNVDKVKVFSEDLLERNIKRFMDLTSEIDSKLSGSETKEITKKEEIEDYILQAENELKKLKNEMESFSS